MFIKVADREVEPSTLILGPARARRADARGRRPGADVGGRAVAADLRAHWRPLVVIGLLNTAVPFWLLSWGETRIDSGLASIIQASVPIFNALLAFGFFHDERVTGRRLIGVAIGFVGVALLVGAQPHAKLLGALAVVGMALCYAAGRPARRGGTWRRRARTRSRSAPRSWPRSRCTPAESPRRRRRCPGWKTFASIAVLGIVCTAFAYLLFFTIIARAGAGYASLVTYLVPPIALGYGAIFLDESVGAAALVGLALILAGVTLGTRRVVRRRRPAAAEAPA